MSETRRLKKHIFDKIFASTIINICKFSKKVPDISIGDFCHRLMNWHPRTGF